LIFFTKKDVVEEDVVQWFSQLSLSPAALNTLLNKIKDTGSFFF